VFTAPMPAQATLDKYDPGVGDMLGLLRFGAGLPNYRLAQLQDGLGVPLPASTQWELMDQAARFHQPVLEALIDVAAQASLIHNDDTTMRVQSLRRQILRDEGQNKRTGIFTTGIIAQVGEHQVALYLTGTKHAGENLDELLRRRPAGLDKPLLMCDGLSRNLPKEFEIILCNCMCHSRRDFVDVVEAFPQQCRFVIESLGQVYAWDAQAKEQKLSPAERLALHQEQSKPVMDRLHTWLNQQLEQKLVEPNCGLGEAIGYMLKHWEPLTRFLSVAGAPLDNNICERALKKAILHRKNSMSYRTLRGAQVGDLFMSLIQTCTLNRVNPLEYLKVLRHHADQVRQHILRWLPWNFHQNLPSCDSS
jgi:transposase